MLGSDKCLLFAYKRIEEALCQLRSGRGKACSNEPPLEGIGTVLGVDDLQAVHFSKVLGGRWILHRRKAQMGFIFN